MLGSSASPDEGFIVAVTGMPGSGKSLVASMLSEALSCPVVSMGDAVRREVARRGLEVNARNVESVARELRERYGMAAVAYLVLDDVREAIKANGCVVVDGVRGMEEVRVFRRVAPVCVVAVHASPATRYERMARRRRAGEGVEDFRLRDEMNLRFGIGEVIALADYMIVNEWGLEDLRAQVERVAGELPDARARCGGGGG